jgi:hypothetical protein
MEYQTGELKASLTEHQMGQLKASSMEHQKVRLMGNPTARLMLR